MANAMRLMRHLDYMATLTSPAYMKHYDLRRRADLLWVRIKHG